MARTTGVGELVTAYPHAYYPEDSWQDDMELGAVELALAARALRDPRGTAWLRRHPLGQGPPGQRHPQRAEPVRHQRAGPRRPGAGAPPAPAASGSPPPPGLYRRLTGDRRYDAFGVQQRNWVLGANAWGTSLVIGEGTVFPHCPQHQVANLAGSLTGGREVPVGAVVNGRNRFAAFDRADARFLDDVRAWPSVEPAIDFTATGMLAFALAAAG